MEETCGHAGHCSRRECRLSQALSASRIGSKEITDEEDGSFRLLNTGWPNFFSYRENFNIIENNPHRNTRKLVHIIALFLMGYLVNFGVKSLFGYNDLVFFGKFDLIEWVHAPFHAQVVDKCFEEECRDGGMRPQLHFTNPPVH